MLTAYDKHLTTSPYADITKVQRRLEDWLSQIRRLKSNHCCITTKNWHNVLHKHKTWTSRKVEGMYPKHVGLYTDFWVSTQTTISAFVNTSTNIEHCCAWWQLSQTFAANINATSCNTQQTKCKSHTRDSHYSYHLPKPMCKPTCTKTALLYRYHCPFPVVVYTIYVKSKIS